MSFKKEQINIVWFKRDLRLSDNEAIFNAFQTNKRTLFIYVFENLLIEDSHFSERHWNFIKESIKDINEELKRYNSKVLVIKSDIIATINQLLNHYQINDVYSHQETGILITYERDKAFKRYCNNNRINWHENINNGVERELKNRDNWFENWNTYMQKPLFPFNPSEKQLISIEEINLIESFFKLENLDTPIKSSFQKGGTKMAWKYANSFFNSRLKDYMFNISKPEASRTSCSRISPYLAWGNLSVREVYQKANTITTTYNSKRHLDAFISRLRWQAHFIQKFEMEHTMEESSVNKGYHKLKKSISKSYQIAWQNGKTGFPLVDASMRCLNETGYLNFRMRALVVSFFTHILWQPWQEATTHLSSMFLDFEPGIHFPQLQMQAGETGINNLRIYNPIKNGLVHDPDALFIKKWVPELYKLDPHFAHEPYLMTELEQQFYNFKLGIDYPYPIVDIKSNRKKASDILWAMKNNNVVISENQRILKKHTINDRKRMLKNT